MIDLGPVFATAYELGGAFAAGSIIECRPPFFVTKTSNGRTQSLMLSNVKA